MERCVELWVVRHGETEWSASGKHTSRTDIPLTEQGRKRAELLRNYLKGMKFDAVLVSPMKRARETCEIAGLASQAVVEDGLKEWDYGIYEGRTTEEIRKEEPGWSVWTCKIVGGETVEQVGERADGVIARALKAESEIAKGTAMADGVIARALAAKGDAGKVILFAHAHILRILAARWVELPAKDGALLTLGTGSVSVLGWERETRVIEHWNRGFGG